MKLFVPVALILLASYALADDARSKRRLVHSDPDLADNTSAQNEPGSMETAGTAAAAATALTSASTEAGRHQAGHDREEGPADALDAGTTHATGTATPRPRRKNKKGSGSSRRSGTKTSNQEGTREDNGAKRKSNRTQKKKIIPNSKLLARLGLTRVESGSHYRKRLAGTAQRNEPSNYKGHQKRILENLDSRMYVIKLPPSSYYYAPHHEDKFRLGDPGHKHFNNLGINFNSNGKPSKVYHYNIPIINKIVGRKTNSNFYKYDDDINDPLFLGQGAGESSVYNVQNLENHSTSNELGLSSSSSNPDQDKSSHKKYGPKKTVTYMKPKPAKQFTKYFPSNGKPHAFYIIENSSTPYYHRLLP